MKASELVTQLEREHAQMRSALQELVAHGTRVDTSPTVNMGDIDSAVRTCYHLLQFGDAVVRDIARKGLGGLLAGEPRRRIPRARVRKRRLAVTGKVWTCRYIAVKGNA